MVWSGHMSLRKLKTSGRGPCISTFVVICFETIIARLSCSIRLRSVIASRDVFTVAFTLQFRLAATTTSL